MEPPSPTANQRSTPLHGPGADLVERFAQMVDRHGDRPAVSAEGTVLSYAQLDARAGAIAQVLPATLDEPAPLALLLDPGVDAIVAIVAILKSGQPYVALNTSDPPERVRTILGDCGSTVLLVNAATADTAAGLAPDSLRLVDVSQPPSNVPDRGAAPPAHGDLAYVLYTSGSTGTP